MTTADAALALGVSLSTVKRLIAAGELEAVRVRRSVRIPAAAVSLLLETRRP